MHGLAALLRACMIAAERSVVKVKQRGRYPLAALVDPIAAGGGG